VQILTTGLDARPDCVHKKKNEEMDGRSSQLAITYCTQKNWA